MSFGCVGEYDDLDLPQLHSIELDYCALRGDERDEQKALEEKPYNYKNTLIMKSGMLYDGGNDRSPFPDILQELSMQLPVCWVCYA